MVVKMENKDQKNENMIPKKVCASEVIGHLMEKKELINVILLMSISIFALTTVNKIAGLIISASALLYGIMKYIRNKSYIDYIKKTYNL